MPEWKHETLPSTVRKQPFPWHPSNKAQHNISHINQIMIKGIFQITSPFPSRISSVFHFQEDTRLCATSSPAPLLYFYIDSSMLLNIDCIKERNRNIFFHFFFFRLFASIHYKYEPDEMEDIRQWPMLPRGTKGLIQVSHQILPGPWSMMHSFCIKVSIKVPKKNVGEKCNTSFMGGGWGY